jgi:hypothetical protein
VIENSLYQPSPRQKLQYDLTEAIANTFGQFDQSTTSEGAHYAPAEKNPFVNQGLKCSNCYFFEGPLNCEVVSGTIDPNGVCKLWIIPNELITEGN